jgi:hypothetical protein
MQRLDLALRIGIYTEEAVIVRTKIIQGEGHAHGYGSIGSFIVVG